MTAYILKRWPRFDNFLTLFNTKLGKPAQRHLLNLMIAFIMSDGRKNMAGLNRALCGSTHPSCLSRFIGEVEWGEQVLEQTRLNELNRRVRRYIQAQTKAGSDANPTLPAFLCKVVVSRSLPAHSNPRCGIKAYNYRLFVSSDPALGGKTVCEFYSVRWEIETFHAQAKELLGLDHNQCWRERNVWRMWTLLLITYSYLLLEAVEHWEDYAQKGQTSVNIAQVVAHHKREAQRGLAHFFYQKALDGCPLEQVLAQIAA